MAVGVAFFSQVGHRSLDHGLALPSIAEVF
jgi:hypothetical protein